MARPKVLLLGKIELAHKEWSKISCLAEIIEPKARSREEFIQECKVGAFDGVVAAFRTVGSVAITGKIDEDLVPILPRSLNFIVHNGAGYDQIDVHTCTEHDIQVANVPMVADNATADVNMFLILGALRGFNTSMVALRNGLWKGFSPPTFGHDPQGKVLGILGMGGIGQNLMKKATAFGMTVQYHNRSKLSGELSGEAKYVSFEELLRTSDVLSLNLPLNKSTHHIISTKEFELMKECVVIVNTSRGAVMDEDALVKALHEGKVWSCGLDVFEDEPKVHPGLIANSHVMLLPHMGTWTVETQMNMEIWCIENVWSALVKGRLMSPVLEHKDL
ncbi:hypothetical protein V502_07703 [Pseudogymnoascus sp. VKM F-4520 (FW-2644)]|nr:hypothetical protein V502_07703 [Pseudogymnoascus sp. VKM F-4520 (FW-2644)]